MKKNKNEKIKTKTKLKIKNKNEIIQPFSFFYNFTFNVVDC